MEENAPVIPVTIQPKTVYGLRTDVVGNIHFNLKQEVIYPVEGVLALHDYAFNKQKFLRFPEHTFPLIIAMSPNRKLLAVLERYLYKDKETLSISVYELATLKRRKIIPAPINNDGKEYKFHVLIFSSDSRALLALSKYPDESIYMFVFDKTDTVLHGLAINPNVKSSAICIASNPSDPGLVAIAGDNLFKLVMKSEKGFTVNSIMKPDGTCISSMAWLTSEIIAAGSTNGCLIFIENGEVRARYDAFIVEDVDLVRAIETEENVSEVISELTPTVTKSDEDSNRNEDQILCMTAFSKGFAYAIRNTVYVFEKESKFHFERKSIITLSFGIYPKDTYNIKNIAINQEQDTIIVTPLHSQIYMGILIVPESVKSKNLEFKELGQPLHTKSIIDLSICSWKPIIITASKDRTVRIWNYETGKTEMVKKFKVDILVLELNPTGLFVAIGFLDELRIMEIFLDDLQIMKLYNFPRSRDIAFSHLGHLMAVAYENLIAITSVVTFDVLKILKGHSGDVMSIAWSYDDKFLISGGIEGAIYQWDVETGTRVHEIVQKGVQYHSLQVTHDPLSIYAVTNLGTLREISNSELVREIHAPSNASLLATTLSRSDLIMFISSSEGHLYNVQLPFLDAGGGTCTNYRFFHSAITHMRISYDGTLLFTTSSDGTLAIWVMKNIDDKIVPIDQDLLKCTDILVPRKLYLEKIEAIKNLELRMQQLIEEHQFKIAETERQDNFELEELHKGYCAAIEELKEKNKEVEEKHIKEMAQITEDIKQIKSEHEEDMNHLATQFSERMLVEYQKIQNLRISMIEMRESYEEKLRKSAGCLQATIDELESDFKKQLQERQKLIRKLMQEMEDKKIEFVEYCRQVEMDNDRNMVESQLQYEKKLKNQEDETLKWRNEAGVLRKKYKSRTKETEELADDVENLKLEHEKYQKEILSHLMIIEELKREISLRDLALVDKQKRIQEVHHKNMELEKYKQVLDHKVTELNSQIEPREKEMTEKRNQIAEMERELEGLHNNNIQLELQLSEMKDKLLGSETELKVEQQRCRLAKNHISRIASEIYEVSRYINHPDQLKRGIKMLFQKYSDNSEMKKSIILDAQSESEYHRQREHIERMADSCRKARERKKESFTVKKLINENVILLRELNNLRCQYKEAQNTISNLESILGPNWKTSTTQSAKAKLEKAALDFDKMQENQKNEKEFLQNQIDFLHEENKSLKFQILTKTAPN